MIFSTQTVFERVKAGSSEILLMSEEKTQKDKYMNSTSVAIIANLSLHKPDTFQLKRRRKDAENLKHSEIRSTFDT